MVPELLKKLYCIRSYSKKEDEMIAFIKSQIPDDYRQYARNIYRIKDPTQPILCAHMDQVNCSSFPLIKSMEEYRKYLDTYDKYNDTVDHFEVSEVNEVGAFNAAGEQISLGADDKNGIYIILELLKEYPDLNFVFTVEEETGMKGATELCNCTPFTEFLKKAPYMILLDRRNGRDIIHKTYSSKYSVTLHYYIEDLSEYIGLDYKSETGLASDANKFSEYIECVNLSVGYYKPHSKDEYTDLDELTDTYNLVHSILEDPTFGDAYAKIHPKAFKELMGAKTSSTTTYYNKNKEDKKEDEKKSESKVIMSASKYTQICPLCESSAITKYEMGQGKDTLSYIDCADCDGSFLFDNDLNEWVEDTYGYKYEG